MEAAGGSAGASTFPLPRLGVGMKRHSGIRAVVVERVDATWHAELQMMAFFFSLRKSTSLIIGG